MNESIQTGVDRIAIVQMLYKAFLSRDFNAILNMLSDDVEWGEPANPFNLAGGRRYGHEGFLEWLKAMKQKRFWHLI